MIFGSRWSLGRTVGVLLAQHKPADELHRKHRVATQLCRNQASVINQHLFCLRPQSLGGFAAEVGAQFPLVGEGGAPDLIGKLVQHSLRGGLRSPPSLCDSTKAM